MIPDNAKQKYLDESRTRLLTKSEDRIKSWGEVFTPPELVIEILKQLPDQLWDEGKTYLDPTAGDGNFLAAVLIIKMELGHENPLSTIYGVDIMQDNVDECRQRLIDIAGDTPENWDTVRNNIRCEDGLKYDYSFTKKPTPVETLQKEATAPKKEKKKEDKPVETTFSVFFDIDSIK